MRIPGLEIRQEVPLARMLNYSIVISTQNFTSASNICPVAKVVTDSSNNVVSITDTRNMMFRLGSGGDNPNALHTYPWGTRTENSITYSGGSDSFTGEDKGINNLKSWLDATLTRLWELGGGEHWYSGTADREIKLAYGQPVIAGSGDNFYFPLISVTAGNMTRTGGNTVTVSYTSQPFTNGDQIDITPGEANFPAGTKTITSTRREYFHLY